MTKARTILQLLAEGNYSTRQLAEMSGLSVADVQEAIRTLRKGNRVESAPVCYRATPVGVGELSKEPTPPAVLERKKRERHAREERARTIVGQALQSQPALAQVWGMQA